jgi:hypothetical protein
MSNCTATRWPTETRVRSPAPGKRDGQRRIALGIEVGRDRGWSRSGVTPAAGDGATSAFSTEIAEIHEIAENPRLRRRRVPDCRTSAHQPAPPTVGVGATANSAISRISAISVLKAQAETKDRPMQGSKNPKQVIEKALMALSVDACREKLSTARPARRGDCRQPALRSCTSPLCDGQGSRYRLRCDNQDNNQAHTEFHEVRTEFHRVNIFNRLHPMRACP